MKRAKRAFTLIELLIVVAIIAILAAIAVPNFLEAQVRAKAARVESDMRTYATAIESYTVDNNRAPLGFTETGNLGLIGNRQFIYHYLTTPIAYLTALPQDPFCAVDVDRAEAKFYFYNTFYDSVSGQYSSSAQLAKIRSRGYSWAMYSLGPRRAETWPWIEDMLSGGQSRAVIMGNIYDPTNGTVSAGKIYRTNKGEMKDPQ